MITVALGAIAELNPTKPKGLQPDQLCSFVPMEAVDDYLGAITKPVEKQIGEVNQGYTYFANDDVLFAKITPCMENGKCAIARDLVNGVGFGSTEFHVVRAYEDVMPEWIYYFLRQENVRQEAVRHMTGSAGQQRVPTTFLRNLPIPLPPLAEQQRIAGLLRRADRLRRLRRYALDVSAGYLQAVFVEMFGDPVRNPMGWEQQRLGEVIAGFQAGVNIPPISENEPSSEWRVLKVSAVTWGDFDPTASKAIPPDTEFDESLVVRKGDLLISRANTTELVGAVSLVRTQPSKVLLPDKLWRICFKENSQLSPEFTLHALRQEGMRKAIGELATGSSGSMKNISQEKAAILPMTLPPLDLQVRFGEIAERSERVRLQQREALRQAEHLFQALLRRAFAGE